MSKQLIFCLETNKKANTDWIYIKALLDRVYSPDNNVKYTPICMGSKQRYNARETKNSIKESVSMYPGDSYVLMCIDTDKLTSDPVQKKEFEEIKAYCDSNHYSLVWFNIDIEDVFQGHRVEASSKVKEAANYQRSHKINELDLSLFQKKAETQHGSNLMIALETIFKVSE
jgi:hypothetical protein